MNLANIVIGICSLFLAWAFVFKTGLIFRINSWVKEHVFNDQIVLYSRRRMALLLVALGLMALFSGMHGLISQQEIKPQIAVELLEMVERDFQTKRYKQAIDRCKDLVRSDPKNVRAWTILAMSWWTIGEKKQAYVAAEKVLQLDSQFNINQNSVMKIILQSSKEGRESNKTSK